MDITSLGVGFSVGYLIGRIFGFILIGYIIYSIIVLIKNKLSRDDS